ncbi:MAG: GNAT family N-acetyltransferase [Pseudomonadota bacterium]
MPDKSNQDTGERIVASEAAVLRAADAEDYPVLIEMVRALGVEDGHPVGQRSEDALRALLLKPEWGRVFILEPAEEPKHPLGYVIVCFGYSVELGGRDLLIDELYLRPECRGRGHGTATLQALEDWARKEGFASAFLEVMHGNRAEALYRRLGYADRGSVFLGKSLLDEA